MYGHEVAVVYDGLRLMGAAHGHVKRRMEHGVFEGRSPVAFFLHLKM